MIQLTLPNNANPTNMEPINNLNNRRCGLM